MNLKGKYQADGQNNKRRKSSLEIKFSQIKAQRAKLCAHGDQEAVNWEKVGRQLRYAVLQNGAELSK
jgi:hypothetical protein